MHLRRAGLQHGAAIALADLIGAQPLHHLGGVGHGLYALGVYVAEHRHHLYHRLGALGHRGLVGLVYDDARQPGQRPYIHRFRAHCLPA